MPKKTVAPPLSNLTEPLRFKIGSNAITIIATKIPKDEIIAILAPAFAGGQGPNLLLELINSFDSVTLTITTD